MNMISKIFFYGVVLLSCALGQIAFSTPAPGHGFMALSGDQAENFELSFDLHLINSMQLDKQGLISERYQQYFADALVLGGQLTLLKDQKSGKIKHVIGHYYPNIISGNVHKFSPADAAVVVNGKIGSEGKRKIDLMIDPQSGDYFYRVETRRFDSRWFHWINAENGKLVNSYDGLMHGEGIGVLGDTKDLSGLTTFNSQFELISSDGRQTTYDARNRNKLPGTLATDSDDYWETPGRTSPGQPALVDAQFYARVTDNYYLTTHNFDWLSFYSDGIVSSVHVQRNYNNAYWNGEQMAYGDGDGGTFIELSGDLDVVGHELSHGVTDATSNLIYQKESGALNEAFSDIMGTAIEFYYGTGNWTIGEDITPGDNGIRNMADPGEDGDPSHYQERYTGTADNGGVHINSGIINHWFYLLVEGGQNSDPNFASGIDVVGIGLAEAETIAFLGFTALPADADFCGARTSTIAVAGFHATNVADAWDEVGVDASLCNGGSDGGSSEGGPVITDVSSAKTSKGGGFMISWTTDIAADSIVTFTCCGSYSDSALVTSHSMNFRGSKGATYEYYVSSTSSDSATSTKGPFIHQN